MAKEIKGTLKLQILAGQANPSPPVGPALGQAGVNIMQFCKDFNAATQQQSGDLLPTIITVYGDGTFSFVTKQPPAAVPVTFANPTLMPARESPFVRYAAVVLLPASIEVPAIVMTGGRGPSGRLPWGSA